MTRIEALLGNYLGGTIFDHVRSIFDDTVTRGFQHSLHFPQLIDQYQRYATCVPPQQWVPPPDVHSRDASPVLPPAIPRRGLPTSPNPPGTSIPPPVAGASRKGKGKVNGKALEAQKPTRADEGGDSEAEIEEVVPIATVRVKSKTPKAKNSDPPPHNGSPEVEGKAGSSKQKSRPPLKSKATIGQITNKDQPPAPRLPRGAILSAPPCTRCSKSQRECWVVPKGSGKATCLTCRKAKMQCDLDVPAVDVEDEKSARTGKAPSSANSNRPGCSR